MQQTRINQGLPYYEKFIKKFPTVQKLAAANEDDVLLSWQGLGYYSRARNMHHTAKYINSELKGKFPTKANDLIKLKGIGKYTSAAIASFCYNENIAAIDGNVIRVIARLFNIQEPTNKSSTQKLIEQLSKDIITKVNANNYNQAMMDLGAIICTPNKPNCNACPLALNCQALVLNNVEHIPKKDKITKITNRYFTYVLIKTETEILIRKRTENDIWKGLHEFILIETPKSIDTNKLLKKEEIIQYTNLIDISDIEIINAKPHKLSHQTIHATFVKAKCSKLPALNKFEAIKISNIDNFAFPKLLQGSFLNLFNS